MQRGCQFSHGSELRPHETLQPLQVRLPLISPEILPTPQTRSRKSQVGCTRTPRFVARACGASRCTPPSRCVAAAARCARIAAALRARAVVEARAGAGAPPRCAHPHASRLAMGRLPCLPPRPLRPLRVHPRRVLTRGADPRSAVNLTRAGEDARSKDSPRATTVVGHGARRKNQKKMKKPRDTHETNLRMVRDGIDVCTRMLRYRTVRRPNRQH